MFSQVLVSSSTGSAGDENGLDGSSKTWRVQGKEWARRNPTIKNGERKIKENTRSTALSRSRPPSPYVQTAARGSTSRFFCFRSLSMLFFWIHDVMSTEPVLNSTAGHDRDTDGTRTGHGLDTDWTRTGSFDHIFLHNLANFQKPILIWRDTLGSLGFSSWVTIRGSFSYVTPSAVGLSSTAEKDYSSTTTTTSTKNIQQATTWTPLSARKNNHRELLFDCEGRRIRLTNAPFD